MLLSLALNNATLPFVISLTEKGLEKTLLDDANLLNGLNIYRGLLTNEAVAKSNSIDYVPAIQVLNN